MPSDAPREPDASIGGQAVDQGARAAELTVEIIPTADEVVDDLRAQMEELDRRDKEKDAEIERANAARAASDRARQDAENRAAAADRARANAEQVGQRSVETAQLDSIKNSLTTHEGHLTNLKGQLAAATAEGDFSKAADIQAEMAKVGGRIAQLESGAADLEARIKAPVADTGRPTAPQQDAPDERKEAFIRQQPPRIQDWLRSEKGARYFNDTVFAQKVAAAAAYAQNIKNLPIDSQAYLDYVEEQVGLRQPVADDQQPQRRDDRAPSAPGQGRTADAGQRMTTAPAGGSNDGSVRRLPGGQIEVYLTKDEKEMAARQGLTEAEVAKSKRDLINEGLIGPGARNR